MGIEIKSIKGYYFLDTWVMSHINLSDDNKFLPALSQQRQ